MRRTSRRHRPTTRHYTGDAILVAWLIGRRPGSVLAVTKRPDDAKYDPFLVRVGQNVAEARLRAGLTQEELAERLEVIPRIVQKIESGRLNLTLRTIARLADALHADPGALVAGPSANAKKSAKPTVKRVARRKRGTAPRT